MKNFARVLLHRICEENDCKAGHSHKIGIGKAYFTGGNHLIVCRSLTFQEPLRSRELLTNLGSSKNK